MRATSSAALAGAILMVAATAGYAKEGGLAASHDWVKEGGRTCFKDHVHGGSGDGATKESARAAAIRSWADFVDLEYDGTWAHWSLAAGAVTKFTKAEKGWTANVEARPCRR